MKKQKVYGSVTKYLADLEAVQGNKQEFPEVNEEKKSQKFSYFASRQESYLRDGKNVTYTRTSRKDEVKTLSEIVELMVETGPAYLKH